jgi:predicted phage tail protein
MKCIDVQVEGLKEYLVDCHNKNIEFSIQSGNTLIEEFPELYLNVARDEVIITPVPAGSGKGLGKLITGLLLLAAFLFMPGLGATFTTGGATTSGGLFATGAGATGGVMQAGVMYGTGTSVSAAISAGATLEIAGVAVMMLGVNLAMMGLAEMSAPDPDKTTDDPSYLFNGAQNHIEQGKPVPLLYGELTIGGAPIYQGYTPGLQNQYKKGVTLIDGNDTNHSRIGTNPYSGIYTNYATSNAGSPSNQPSSGWVGTGNNTFDQVIDYITTPSSGLAKTPLPDDIFEQAK